MRVSVIIPTRNEALAIGRVLADLPWDLVNEVIVVDNASDDPGTFALYQELEAVLAPRRALHRGP